jgi:hypothetical protein
VALNLLLTQSSQGQLAATPSGTAGPGQEETAGPGAGPAVEEGAVAFPGSLDLPPRRSLAWGIAELRGFVLGQQTAPNGVDFRQLFSLDLNFNCWLWPAQGVYLFADAKFWGQKASPGVTNSNQGVFDFSKREMDLNLGAAWNYWGQWEARFFAYSANNLNRGTSPTKPTGYADGAGLENRYYLWEGYAHLGTEAFDAARATFVSLGFYPSKDMTDGEGLSFRPGPFGHAYLTWDLYGECLYVFADVVLIGTHSFTPKLLQMDGGVAARPFSAVRRVEFRVGTEGTYDLQYRELAIGVYGSIRLVF